MQYKSINWFLSEMNFYRKVFFQTGINKQTKIRKMYLDK